MGFVATCSQENSAAYERMRSAAAPRSFSRAARLPDHSAALRRHGQSMAGFSGH
jgi:hypothetical protein